MPQGTVLAPLLFLMYTNDLPTCVQNKVGLYADNALIYSYINSKDDCTSLQLDLTALEQWSLKCKCHSTLQSAYFYVLQTRKTLYRIMQNFDREKF